MIKLEIYIEIRGEQVKAGEIRGRTPDECVFRYSPGYTGSRSGMPISVSLPLQDKAFSPVQTRNFFSGLLPEGFMRKRVSELAHVGTDNYTEILADLGSECIGAIRVADSEHAPKEAGYIKLEHGEIAALAGEGAIEASELVMKAHLSLTGASGKVGLYFNKENGEWFLPEGDAPSTHIVKQSHVRLGGIVANEQLCLMTAGKLGIEVPHSFIVATGGWHDSNVLLATERFDRTLMDRKHTISGLEKPFRLHQEDFAQALGIGAGDKYEMPGDRYLSKAFRLLLDRSSRPLEDQLRLWDIIVFDYLAGNTDNHLKNISLLYSKDLSSCRLAPAYDLLSTSVYEMSTDNMAFSIGGDLSLPEITRDSFSRAADDAGISRTVALRRFDAITERFEEALSQSSEELTGMGFLNASELTDRILESGGISRV